MDINRPVSVLERYGKNPHWNVVLESEFLQNVANSKHAAKNRDAPLEPLIKNPEWSLTILPEMKKNTTSNFQQAISSKRLNKQFKKNEMKLKKKLKGRIFNVEEDWNDLFLVQRRLGLEVTSRRSHVAEDQDSGEKRGSTEKKREPDAGPASATERPREEGSVNLTDISVELMPSMFVASPVTLYSSPGLN